MSINVSLESRKDFKETPSGQYSYWMEELKASQKKTGGWVKQGTRIVEKFKGGSRKNEELGGIDPQQAGFRLNLFHSNIITLQSTMYGNLPKVDVTRRYNDPNDDVGRVAALIMQRLLNNDIEDNGEDYNSMLRSCLQDRLLPGLGCARVSYTMNTEPQEVEGEIIDSVVEEKAPIDYYHWRDVQWGWGRTFSELPWIAFRSYFTKDEIKERFGEEAAEGVELKNQRVTDKEDEMEGDNDSGGPWKKAEIWEIWDKSKRRVVWLSVGYPKTLDSKDDFLGLSSFYPCPPFLLANSTTSLYMPTPDYHLGQDLYNEVDALQTRISIITQAVKVVGVYDASAEEIARMFDEGTDNDLIPVERWAMFKEGGGVQGSVEWFPIKEVVEALDHLRGIRDETIGLLQQVTGMSDLMRGELGNQYEGVGQTQMKAKFGSIRIQAMQDEFATFASNLLQLKAEVISLHFEPKSIAAYANLDASFDKELLPQAFELLKNPQMAKLRVRIRPESVSMVDYAQLKEERSGYITALATFMQSASPIMEQDPEAKPYLLELLKWGLAGFKGANEIEGVMDRAIDASSKQSEEGEKPDPAAEAAQMGHKMSMEFEQAKHQHNLAELQAKAQSASQVRQADGQADLMTIMADLQADIKKIYTKMEADIATEQNTSQINAEQQAMGVENEIEKDIISTELEIEKMKQQVNLNSEDS